ncbi:hypothetical protein EDC01DRAFT_633123 [Geopyxis carbonaria]|nr:hypothetical protein EDC01DRAFT_633123 [Geopyxis carbonaria]
MAPLTSTNLLLSAQPYATPTTNRSNTSLVEDKKIIADVLSLSQMIQQHITNFYDINPKSNPKFYRRPQSVELNSGGQVVLIDASEFADAPVNYDYSEIDFFPRTPQCFEVALRRCIGKCILDYMEAYIACGAPIELKRAVLDCKLDPYAHRNAHLEKQRKLHIGAIYELSQSLAEVLWVHSDGTWKFDSWKDTSSYKTEAQQMQAPVFPGLFKGKVLVMHPETIDCDVTEIRVATPIVSQSPSLGKQSVTVCTTEEKRGQWWRRGKSMAKLYRRRKAPPHTKQHRRYINNSNPNLSDYTSASDDSDYHTASESPPSSRNGSPERSIRPPVRGDKGALAALASTSIATVTPVVINIDQVPPPMGG